MFPAFLLTPATPPVRAMPSTARWRAAGLRGTATGRSPIRAAYAAVSVEKQGASSLPEYLEAQERLLRAAADYEMA